MQICKSKPGTFYSVVDKGREPGKIRARRSTGMRKEKEGIGKNATETTSSQERYPNTSTTTVRPKFPDLLVVNEFVFLIIILVQSRSAEICDSESEIQHLATKTLPTTRAAWSITVQITTGYPNDPHRKTQCRYRCETFCRSSAKWRDCIAFASQVKAHYNSDCLCWGYESLPSFGSNVSIGEATYLNGWCVSEFFSNGMTF